MGEFLKENIIFIEVNFSIHMLKCMLDIFLFTLNTIMPVILLMVLGVGGSNGQRWAADGTIGCMDNNSFPCNFVHDNFHCPCPGIALVLV